ncbi:MAG: phytanoyl-CoA dioxygenase family protein [Chloroflexi bacterium]|nr:phytanoyl-CoA dioxygenase family protein [Chloroflexota bacterium]
MGSLTSAQVRHFDEWGFVQVDDVFDPAQVLDPIVEEYEGVLDRLADELFEAGEISSRHEDLPFGERITEIYSETGRVHSQFFDFSLPFSGVSEDTPFWTGAAVFNAFTSEPLLDAIESLIGPEIYSNPVQHVRIKPPEHRLPKNDLGNPIIGATPWHQDHGVVIEEADETNMLTVWFPLQDAMIEKGPLKVVPGSHRGDLLTHCIDYPGNGKEFAGARQIPEKLFDADGAVPLPTKRGGAVFMHKRTVHSSLPNVSDEIRWSFDLRYNPTDEPTGRPLFPGFVARSRSNPETELRDADRWTQMWTETRSMMAKINQGGQEDVKFGRWDSEHPDCA